MSENKTPHAIKLLRIQYALVMDDLNTDKSLDGWRKVSAKELEEIEGELTLLESLQEPKGETAEELQKAFFKETGLTCINSHGEPDIDYVEWLEERLGADSKGETAEEFLIRKGAVTLTKHTTICALMEEYASQFSTPNKGLTAERQKIVERIVDEASRMIKQHEEPEKGGMTEIPMRFINSLDSMMHELSMIELKISQEEIDKQFPKESSVLHQGEREQKGGSHE